MSDTQTRIDQDYARSRVAELLRLKNRFDTIFNNVLCDMKPGWDDSIEGFNKAWDIARDIFQEEIGRATAAALSSPDRINSAVPCYKGGHKCSWPACPQECDGRPGASPGGAD